MAFLSLIKLAILTYILFSISAVAQGLGKKSLWGGKIDPLIEPTLWKNLAPTRSIATQGAAGLIPQLCADAVSGERPQLRLSDVEVFSVKYADCQKPWSFCRHKDAPISQAAMIDVFGRMPVHERQWIRHIVAVPGPNSAYSSNGVVVFKGNMAVPSVFQHEITHALDRFNKYNLVTTDRPEWKTAIDRDTCVPDNYANAASAEDFAQIGVVALFEKVYPGGLEPAFGPAWHCLRNQFTVFTRFHGDSITPGGRCTRRAADSMTMRIKSTQKVSRAEAIAAQDNVLGMLEILDEPVDAAQTHDNSHDHVYENLFVNETEHELAAARQEAWAKEAKLAGNTKRARRVKL